MLTNIKAAIFDMDGTLIDSMGVWSKIDTDFLEQHGFKVPADLKSNIEHLTFQETALFFQKTFSINNTVEEIVKEWASMADYEYTHNIRLKPKAKEYLLFLKASGVKLGIATSNSLELVEKVLKNNGIYEYFHSITTVDEVTRGKSFPDIYLLEAEKLGVNPCECMVFEDILPAVLGAKAAGMKVVGVHDIYSDYQREDIQLQADKFIFTFDELIDAS